MDKYEGPGSVLHNGSLLAEAQSVQVSGTSNNRPVMTMRKGLAGRSRGPYETEINISNAVPLAGLEHEYIEACAKNDDVTVVVLFAGRRYQYEGWIDTVQHENNQDAAASLSYVVKAGPPRIL